MLGPLCGATFIIWTRISGKRKGKGKGKDKGKVHPRTGHEGPECE
jgi:hypothetical protein